MRFILLCLVVVTAAACNRSPVHPEHLNGTPASPSSQALKFPDSDQGGRPLEATLTGAAEVPGPGDPDGRGTAVLTTNFGQGEICYALTVSNIDPATEAHIHQAPAGEEGPIVFALTPPTSGSSRGCFTVSDSTASTPLARRVAEIFWQPSEYYVNVHNAAFPDGAIRGQLSK